MTNDIVYIFTWWLLFLTLGLISLPLCYLIFRRFVDIGYGLAKTIGLLIIVYLVFLVNISKLLPLTATVLYSVLVLYAFINLGIFLRHKRNIYPQIRKKIRILAAQEILFTVGLLFWSLIRSYHPDINGLEKFMDLGFINSILNTQYLPPVDMWFAGLPINYYWFGHLYVAVATKLSSIPSHITYNLMLATILGLTLTGAFTISASLIKKLNPKIDTRVAFAAGLISAILLAFAGSFHAPIYLVKNGPDKYWYPDATRFIGYHPETNDKTIHEFPIYSFVVSDLHAHLINLPFVLLYLALIYNFLSKKKDKNIKRLIGLLPLGFVLGVMFMTNTWDFGNYLLVSGVAFLVFNLRKKLDLKIIWSTGWPLVIIVIVGLLTSLPFILNFTSLAEGIKFTQNRSPLWQLGVLWGFPAFLTTIFVVLIYRFRNNLKKSDLFVISLLISSWVLIIIPEIIFVKDIYIASHQRANTIFKLTYQAYVMFYLSSGYIAVRSLTLLAKKWQRIMTLILFALIFTSILTYPSFAINSYYGELKEYKGLTGEQWLLDKYPSEYAALIWLRENVLGQPVILEAPGDSYTEFNVISSYSGLPTVSGWFVHEWLWRGGASFPQERVGDINEIYTIEDLTLTRTLLDKYEVKYVIVGTLERQKYPNINEEKFNILGTQVFSSGNTKIYQVNNN